MQSEIRLLQAIHQNVEMGTLTVPQLVKRVESPSFRALLEQQARGYRTLADRAERLLTRMGVTPEGPKKWQERMADVMLWMKTRRDRSESHLAEMLLQGGTMGVVQMTRELHGTRAEADSEAAALAHQVLAFQEKCAEEWKKFL